MKNDTYVTGKLCISRLRGYVRSIMAVHHGLGYNTTSASQECRQYLKYAYSLMQNDLASLEAALDTLQSDEESRAA